MTAEYENLCLRKFDMKWIGSDKVCVFIGKRKSGKSWGVRDLLYNNRNIPTITLISGTEKANKFYSNHVPEVFIYDDYNPEITQNILEHQLILRDKYGSGDERAGTIYILDDLMSNSKAWINDKNIGEIFYNGRHYNILFIICMQHPMGLPPNFRTNIDYVFIFHENTLNNRKKIYDHYAGIFPTFSMFCQVMEKCTEDYGCMVIDNVSKSSKIEDTVYWYRADSHDDFKVGSSAIWRYNDRVLKRRIEQESAKMLVNEDFVEKQKEQRADTRRRNKKTKFNITKVSV